MDEARAWNKLECLVRFRFPERIDIIESLAKQAHVEVDWVAVDIGSEGFAVVEAVRTV